MRGHTVSTLDGVAVAVLVHLTVTRRQGMQPEPQSSHLSDIGFSDNEGDDDHEQDNNAGDYSARMEELFDDTEDEDGGRGGMGAENEDEEDIGGFVYSGADAEVIQGTYKQQLRDVLGPDHDGDDELEERIMNGPFGHEAEGADHHLFTMDGIPVSTELSFSRNGLLYSSFLFSMSKSFRTTRHPLPRRQPLSHLHRLGCLRLCQTAPHPSLRNPSCTLPSHAYAPTRLRPRGCHLFQAWAPFNRTPEKRRPLSLHTSLLYPLCRRQPICAQG